MFQAILYVFPYGVSEKKKMGFQLQPLFTRRDNSKFVAAVTHAVKVKVP